MSQNHHDSDICLCLPSVVHIAGFIDYRIIEVVSPYYIDSCWKKIHGAFVDFLGAYNICHVVRMTSSDD